MKKYVNELNQLKTYSLIDIIVVIFS
jgi:hypothetical protein